MSRHIQIVHRASQTLLAEGETGWDITPFEGNYYVRRKCLNSAAFKQTVIPGLCPYKFIYLWMDILLPGQPNARFLAWKYVLPNPLFPFIWYRTAIFGNHPEIEIRTNPSTHPVQTPHPTARRCAPR